MSVKQKKNDTFLKKIKTLNDGFGLTFASINKTLTVHALWDGYIKFQFTKFNLFGEPFEPRIGDVVKDVTTGATAIVTFYTRNALDATIFVSDVTGNWSNGSLFSNNAEIKFLGDPTDSNPIYQVERVMGEVQAKSLGLASEGIGKLIVVDSGASIALTGRLPSTFENSASDNFEYWFYESNNVSGVPVDANIPSVGNNDWTNVYSIAALRSATASPYTRQGMYTVYGTGTTNMFSQISSYVVPEAGNDFYLGADVKLRKMNLLYRAFIQAGQTFSSFRDFKLSGQDLNDSTFMRGRVYFINAGTDSYGETWTWEIAKDKKFQGTFSC